MRRAATILALALALAGCESTNPIFGPGNGGGGGGGGGPGVTEELICNDAGRCVLPGTLRATPGGDIFRKELKDDKGNGYAVGIAYDAATDTFAVDGLGFDGGNVYRRGTRVGSLGPADEFKVYEADSVYRDDVTGTPIRQFQHRAIYAVSTSGNTQLAIVRTGAYIPYGFGGFVYSRNGGVTLPTSGQAAYSGNYAGLRDFNDRGGLQYTTGDMTMAIDFRDFNDGNAVQGYVDNRRIYDMDGNDITAQVIAQINADTNSSIVNLPTLVFTVGPGVMDLNGEIVGEVTSSIPGPGGAATVFESGNYYAILADGAGGAASEVVGIIVVTSGDARETGGFILYR
jgi:hypothetical protein